MISACNFNREVNKIKDWTEVVPIDLVVTIFLQINWEDRKTASLVNKRWFRFVLFCNKRLLSLLMDNAPSSYFFEDKLLIDLLTEARQFKKNLTNRLEKISLHEIRTYSKDKRIKDIFKHCLDLAKVSKELDQAIQLQFKIKSWAVHRIFWRLKKTQKYLMNDYYFCEFGKEYYMGMITYLLISHKNFKRVNEMMPFITNAFIIVDLQKKIRRVKLKSKPEINSRE